MSDLGNKDVFAENLKRYMDMHSLTRADMAKIMNVAYTTFNDWYNAKTYPRIDKIEMLSNYFRIEKSDLIERRKPQPALNLTIQNTIKNMNALNSDGQKQVLDYSSLLIDSGKYERLEDPETQYTYIDTKYAAAAGHGYLNDEYATATRHKVKVQDTPKYDEVIEVRGDSMSPLIADGDIAYVQYNYEYKDEKIYAVQVEDETLIKYCYLEGDILTLVSENPSYKDRIVKLCEDSPVRIIGIVAGWVTPEE